MAFGSTSMPSSKSSKRAGSDGGSQDLVESATTAARRAIPEIPHVTTNYVPLSVLVSNLVYHVHSELQNALETLPSVSSDVVRKRRLLDVIVKSRQEFVKLYVLIKWASVAKDVSQCIDVVAWLNGQQNCFANLVNVLFNMQRSLLGAKLKSPDIQTALEVLTYGRPIHKDRGFIAAEPLSSQTVLDTLREMDILLAIRLALSENLPEPYRCFTIRDGRVQFTIEDSFIVDLAVASAKTDARFFFVGFQFCFPGSHGITLPPVLKAQIEAVTNKLAAAGGPKSEATTPSRTEPSASQQQQQQHTMSTTRLQSVFDFLLKFTQNYKLSFLSTQLAQMQRLLWAGVLAHALLPEKSLLTIKYWLGRPWQGTLQIGLRPNSYKLGVVWNMAKSGSGGGTTTTTINLASTDEFKQCIERFAKDLDIETLINSVINLHVRFILADIERALEQKHNLSCQVVDNNKLQLHLCEGRYVLFSVDSLSGRFVLQSHNLHIVRLGERKLSQISDYSPDSVAQTLYNLRYASKESEIRLRARACGWQHAQIDVSPDDIAKFTSGDSGSLDGSIESWICLRLSDWPLQWFLLVIIDTKDMIRWYMSRMQCREKVWRILFCQEIKVPGTTTAGAAGAATNNAMAVPDHSTFDRLASFVSTRFMVNTICSELDSRNAKYTLLQAAEGGISSPSQQQRLPTVLINMPSINKEWNQWAHSSLLVSFKNNGTEALVQGRILGDVSNIDFSGASKKGDDSSSPTLDVDASGRFVLRLSCVGLDNGLTFLNSIARELSRIERMVSYLRLVKQLDLPLIDASMDSLTFLYGQDDDVSNEEGNSVAKSDTADEFINVDEPDNKDVVNSSTALTRHAQRGYRVRVYFDKIGNMRLELAPDSPHGNVASALQYILASHGLPSVIYLLGNTLPLYRSLSQLESNDQMPVTIIYRSVVEIRILFHQHRVSLDLRLVERRNKLIVHVREMTVQDPSPLGGTGIWKRPFTVAPKPGDTKPVINSKIIPLMTGAACEIECIPMLLKQVQQVLSSTKSVPAPPTNIAAQQQQQTQKVN